MATTTFPSGENEVTILTRVLGNEQGELSSEVARYLLTVGFSDQDKARMRELANRNQEDALTPSERDELIAFAKAGTLISILKSKARRTLGRKPDPDPKPRPTS